MLAVIKRHVKAAEGRERLDSGFGMTDRADRAFVVGKLLNMTASTRQMARKLGRCQTFLSFVADETRHSRMLRFGMLKSHILLDAFGIPSFTVAWNIG